MGLNMLSVIQRVSKASVTVDDRIVGEIGFGLLVLLCAVEGDTTEDAEILADRICGLRIFNDDMGKMNRSLADVNGSLLVVSQFTLAADIRHGRRPSFSGSASPEIATRLCDRFCEICRESGFNVATGEFGASMSVSLINEGPVTIWLDSRIFPMKGRK